MEPFGKDFAIFGSASLEKEELSQKFVAQQKSKIGVVTSSKSITVHSTNYGLNQRPLLQTEKHSE